jgi:hypothetical protein
LLRRRPHRETWMGHDEGAHKYLVIFSEEKNIRKHTHFDIRYFFLDAYRVKLFIQHKVIYSIVQ